MANSKTPTTYELEHKATGRSWSTTDRAEVTNLRARGWTVKAAPKADEAPAQTGDAKADAKAAEAVASGASK